MITLLRNLRTVDGRLVDVTFKDGFVRDVCDVATPSHANAAAAPTPPADEVHDFGGQLIVPAAAEPHAHLDKAFTADLVPNPAGDLPGAIAAWRTHRATLTVDDIATRAERAARALLANGVTAVRTHVDLGFDIGLRGVEALCLVRERLRSLMHIEIVTLAAGAAPGSNPALLDGLIGDALAIGADAVGGAPCLDDDPQRAIVRYCELAAEHNVAIDLHVDETLDEAIFTLGFFATQVERAGLHSRATASHCVSLAMQPLAVQYATAEHCATAGVSVVALPQTNLFLQARGVHTAPPRAITAIAALRARGVNVAAGADNVQDPFNTVGRADPLETAALLTMACHLSPTEAYELVSDAARRALRLAPVGLVPGSPADFVVIDAPNLRAAVANAPATRAVFRGGRLVAQTTVQRTMLER